MSTLTPVSTGRRSPGPALSVTRLNVVRFGYLFMALGLTLTRWPRLLDATDRPLYEGVAVCMLVAMSLLAWLGLRHPLELLPILLFEAIWKLLWLGTVALPLAVAGDLDTATWEVMLNCTLVVVVLVVIPWRHVWSTYVRAKGDRWR